MLPQAGQHCKTGERFEGCGSAGGANEFRSLNELFVDLLLLGDPQAVWHLDDADARPAAMRPESISSPSPT
jgi:hypothetical protein